MENNKQLLAAKPRLTWAGDSACISCGSSWLTITAWGETEPSLRLRGKEQLIALSEQLQAWRNNTGAGRWCSVELPHSGGWYCLTANRSSLEFGSGQRRIEISATIMADLSNWLLINSGAKPNWNFNESLVAVKHRGGWPMLRITPPLGGGETVMPRFKGAVAAQVVCGLLQAAATPNVFGFNAPADIKLNDDKLSLSPGHVCTWLLSYKLVLGRILSVELSRTGLVALAIELQNYLDRKEEAP